MKLMKVATELAEHAMGVLGEAVKHIHFKKEQVEIDFGDSQIILRGKAVKHLWKDVDHFEHTIHFGKDTPKVRKPQTAKNDAWVNELCRRYAAGESSYELGQEYGRDPATLRTILVSHGQPLRSRSEAQKLRGAKMVQARDAKRKVERPAQRKQTPTKEKAICRRYAAGETTRELAEAYGTNKSTITDILRRNGTRVRGPAEARRLQQRRKKGEVQ